MTKWLTQTAFQMMKSAMEKLTKRGNKVRKGWYNLGDPRNLHWDSDIYARA